MSKSSPRIRVVDSRRRSRRDSLFADATMEAPQMPRKYVLASSLSEIGLTAEERTRLLAQCPRECIRGPAGDLYVTTFAVHEFVNRARTACRDRSLSGFEHLPRYKLTASGMRAKGTSVVSKPSGGSAPPALRTRQTSWLERVRTKTAPNPDTASELKRKGPGWHHGGN